MAGPAPDAVIARAHRLVSYRVSSTPPGNVRVSTRFRFTQLVQRREERRAAAHQDRMGDDRVLVDQPGPHGCPGERRAADVHRAAVLGLEPGDLGDRVAGDQAGVPVDLVDRRGEHHLRHVPPAARELDLRRCGAGLLVGRSASGSSSPPTACARTAPGPSPATRSDHHWNSSSLGDESGPSPHSSRGRRRSRRCSRPGSRSCRRSVSASRQPPVSRSHTYRRARRGNLIGARHGPDSRGELNRRARRGSPRRS